MTKKSAITFIRLLAFGGMLALLLMLCGCKSRSTAELRVEVLDVGQSDCVLITQGDSVLLIDTGTATEREAVRGALQESGVGEIDYLLLTHPHEDHIGNARMVVESYTVGALLVPPVDSDESGYRLVLDAAGEHGTERISVRAGDAFALGDAELEILQAGSDANDPNNSSIVLRITFGETVFLFTGDNEKEGEAALLAAVPHEKLACDFLKAGHHGSGNSTGEALLQVAAPAHVAISCGENNDYGFPDKAVLERLAAIQAEWHSTHEEGSLVYVSDGTHVVFAK